MLSLCAFIFFEPLQVEQIIGDVLSTTATHRSVCTRWRRRRYIHDDDDDDEENDDDDVILGGGSQVDVTERHSRG